MNNNVSQTEEFVISKIYELRGKKIMIDRDLAELYGVKTKVLKQAVRRNSSRFPKDFMFEMTKEEFDNWRSQFVTSNSLKMGSRYAPFCFTEQGVTMLSCVLNSQRAIEVNIQIIRTFTKMRELLMMNKDFLLEIEKIRKQVSNQDEKIEMIFKYLHQFIKGKEKPRTKIGFKK